MAWEGGFLDRVGIHLNIGLNVLIGGRGSGKSTVLESVRFALGLSAATPRGRDQHAQVIAQVLGTAGKVTLLMESAHPFARLLRVERTVGGESRLSNLTGESLVAAPVDLLPDVEVYGQRELADMADDKAQQVTIQVAR